MQSMINHILDGLSINMQALRVKMHLYMMLLDTFKGGGSVQAEFDLLSSAEQRLLNHHLP
jgi:hypothetical protein